MFNKNQNVEQKKAPKRFDYTITAFIQIKGVQEPIQIQNISKTGIQFLSNASIPKQTQIRLMWQDPRVGSVESNLIVVRSIPKSKESAYLYCYGSKFVNFDIAGRKNLNRVVEISEEFERQTHVKTVETLNFKTINDVIVRGRMFLQNTLRGNSGGIMNQFTTDLKEYEKESFNHVDPVSQWIQKLATQYFHTRILISVLMSSVRMNEINKVVTDKLHSMDCLIAECKTFMATSKISDNPQIPLRESFNRMVYARLELKDTFNKSITRLLGDRKY